MTKRGHTGSRRKFTSPAQKARVAHTPREASTSKKDGRASGNEQWSGATPGVRTFRGSGVGRTPLLVGLGPPAVSARQPAYTEGVSSNAAKVREFQAAVGEPSPHLPTLPSPERLALRRTLIREEYAEVLAELSALEQGGGDLASLAHELVDLLYVTYGTLSALGIDADAVFAEVHRANMHKTHGPRRADGKQLKPEGWQPADVRGVLERQS